MTRRLGGRRIGGKGHPQQTSERKDDTDGTGKAHQWPHNRTPRTIRPQRVGKSFRAVALKFGSLTFLACFAVSLFLSTLQPLDLAGLAPCYHRASLLHIGAIPR